MLRAAIIGASGYSGAELLRLLLSHPHCKEISLFSSTLPSGDSAEYSAICPAFYGLGLKIYGLPSSNTAKDEWQNFYRSFNVVFLATPHAVSAQLVRHYMELKLNFKDDGLARIVDLSAALRLQQPELYRDWYREETLSCTELQHCQYGLSELFSREIAAASIVANPGCYATAALLALAPLANNGWLGRVRIDAKSGVSGAGKRATASTHFPQVNESLSLYKLHQHQHIPEIEMALTNLPAANNVVKPITLATHLLPITRGIMATCYVELSAQFWNGVHTSSDNDATLQRIYRDFYAGSPFVQIRPPEGEYSIPQIQDVSFSNRCDIGLRVNPRNHELVAVAVIDNLLKGAAGQAVQNMNLMFGLPESCGLPLAAALP